MNEAADSPHLIAETVMYTKLRSTEAGQGMVEYIIIVALIALAAIASFGLFGKAIQGQTAQLATQVAGQNNTQGRGHARDAASAAVTAAEEAENLDTYVDADRPND